MAVMPVMPRGTEWTVEDLKQIPDDGLQYELLEGTLIVSPSPTPRHGQAVINLVALVMHHCPKDGLQPFTAPVDWEPDRNTSFQPDVFVAPVEGIRAGYVTGPLVLAVEVLSPSTRKKDLVYKRLIYQEAGVESYWIVDPDEPSVTVLELHDGAYVHTGKAAGDEELVLTVPFPVTIVPSALVTR